MTAPGHDAPARIRESWERNAAAWARAVRARRIESRRVATDAAIVDAVRALAPQRVLDVGCGEGWLCRELAGGGIEAIGIDGAASLVAAAVATGVDARRLDYEAFARAPLTLGRFDAAVCNFSLFERELDPLLTAIARLLRPGGTLLIQTVHLEVPADGGAGGWREEDFAPLGDGFVSAMPWYWRGPTAWRRLLADAGLAGVDLRAVLHPESGEPLSIIIRATTPAGEAPCP